jgi:excinuclease ABC subunit A
MNDNIVIQGAREANLKNINLTLPKNQLIVFSGVSGSGKSSLAFDTIYAEGQRRYIESLSSYARQFLGGLKKPDVDAIDGLSPSIAIDQKTTSNNPRSTVGTVTEIYDYFRLLFARVGTPTCPEHHIPIIGITVDKMVENIFEKENESVVIYAPIAKNKKGTFKDDFANLLKDGYFKIRLNGQEVLLEEVNELDKNQKHNIDVFIDKVKVTLENKSRLYEALETAIKLGNNLVTIKFGNGNEEIMSSTHSCPICGFSIGKIEPPLFSFNSPIGACSRCNGLGVIKEVDPNLLIKEPHLSINQGAVSYFKNTIHSENIEWQEFELLCKLYNISLDTPVNQLSDYQRKILLNGSDKPFKYTITTRSGNMMHRHNYIEGPKTRIERLYNETSSEMMRDIFQYYITDADCDVCKGKRLSKEALSVKIADYNIYELCTLPLNKLLTTINNLPLTQNEENIAKLILKEIKDRLNFLINVGLEYLTLARSSLSLSGGESQRIRLATQIGSKLSGVLYVLDEPSIGLHQKDNARLLESLKTMRDLGNTLIVVEHDEETILAADYIVDIGPGAGIHGGEVVALGTPKEIMDNPNSLTGQYISHKLEIPIPTTRNKGNGKFINILGANANNLKNIDVAIPLGCLVCVSGVSGSGKSSLVEEILRKTIAKTLYNSKVKPGEVKEIQGLENIDKLVFVDQDPIGRTPRSNPATYTGIFDFIRDLFANSPDAKTRGYDKGRFSFNVRGGRCEKCQGDGVIRVPMNFLPDVYVTCEECGGKRYNSETLQIYYKNKNIYDVLESTVEESLEFFKNVPYIKRKIQILYDVGLGYIKLGQPATTLSGGESQRVKLAFELQKKPTGKSLFILDEPTTGLHTYDVSKLVTIFSRLVGNGDTVLVIEHNLDILKVADYIIDLGRDGGEKGGEIIALGTPEEIAKNKNSYTGQYLLKILKGK